MRFRDGLIAARSHIVFILALLASTALIIQLDRWEIDVPEAPMVQLTPGIPDSRHGPLSEEDLQAAAVAWRYFETQTRPDTGLADMVGGFPVATLWTAGSQAMATLAAERLEIVAPDEAERRLAALLDGLSRMPLFDGKLPNRFHDTRNLSPVDRDGQKTVRRDLGWSAVDLGRLLTALEAVRRSHPALAPRIEALLSGWTLGAAVAERRLQAAVLDRDGEVELHQEDRLGFEQVAAKGFALLGFDVSNAQSLAGKLAWRAVGGVEVPVDSRLARAGTRTHAVSEPWLYDGIEYGWDRTAQELAWRVYRAQEARAGELAAEPLPAGAPAVSRLATSGEGLVDRAPWFAQMPVTAEGVDWPVLGGDAGGAESLRTVSTKAAFGWDALLGTPYTARLREAVAPAADAAAGWRAGLYTADGRLNGALSLETNALILEALAFRARGPLLKSWMRQAAVTAAR